MNFMRSSPLKNYVRVLAFASAGTFFAALSIPSLAQNAIMTPAQPSNVVNFQSSAYTEVQQDTIRISLSTTIEGTDANEVQARLKAAVEAALAIAKPQAEEGKMEISTGSFQLNPRYNRDSKITGWQGHAELVLEGTDFARITATAGKIKTLNMGGVSFGLSRKTREAAEEKAQGEAIARFGARAKQLTRAFGFSDYSIREVSVNGNDYGSGQPQPMMMRTMKAEMASDDIPAEPGKSRVEVSVNGSIQMR